MVGSIEVGKAADLVAANLSDLATQPVYSATSTLVYAASRHQVSDVWINGKSVVRGRELCTDAQHCARGPASGAIDRNRGEHEATTPESTTSHTFTQ